MQPLSTITHSLPQIATSYTSFGRIQKYLNAKERQDNRGGQVDATEGKLDNSPSDADEKSTQGNLTNAELIASVQGRYSWTEESAPVIDINSWDIRRGEFALVLGPIGCGKSTLLKALLGELSAFDGSIRTGYAGVSYCDQASWLPNETVRNIIVGPQAFDHAWYNSVMEACALNVDMQSWPEGDQTLAGTKGITMSGGQKHRLVGNDAFSVTTWVRY